MVGAYRFVYVRTRWHLHKFSNLKTTGLIIKINSAGALRNSCVVFYELLAQCFCKQQIERNFI